MIEIERLQIIPFSGHKCPYCRTLFANHQGATACLTKCYKSRVKEAQRIEKAERWQSLMDRPRLEATSVANAVRLLVKYSKEVLGQTLYITEYPQTFTMEISNSHSAPIGMRANWYGEDKKYPRHFPGWKGMWRGTFEGKKKCIHKNCAGGAREISFAGCIVIGGFFDHGFRGFHSDGGSAGRKEFNYGGYLFLDDFPLIKKKVEGELTLKRMRNDKTIANLGVE